MGQYEFPNPEWAEVSQEGEKTHRQALSTLILTHLKFSLESFSLHLSALKM